MLYIFFFPQIFLSFLFLLGSILLPIVNFLGCLSSFPLLCCALRSLLSMRLPFFLCPVLTLLCTVTLYLLLPSSFGPSGQYLVLYWHHMASTGFCVGNIADSVTRPVAGLAQILVWGCVWVLQFPKVLGVVECSPREWSEAALMNCLLWAGDGHLPLVSSNGSGPLPGVRALHPRGWTSGSLFLLRDTMFSRPFSLRAFLFHF